MSGVVRTREVTQLAACFVDADDAVVIRGIGYEPTDMMFIQLPSPDEVTYARKDAKLNPKKKVTLDDYHAFCKSSVKACTSLLELVDIY